MDLKKIEQLHELKEKGIITEEEFQLGKKKALGETSLSEAASNMDSKTYAMLLHLSQFCSFIIPLAGLVVPVVMWITKKEDSYIDEQGKVVANWIISSLIYFAISLMLMLVVIGVFTLIALLICSIIFTVMGAVRANDGIIKNYPLSIRFIKVNETGD